MTSWFPCQLTVSHTCCHLLSVSGNTPAKTPVSSGRFLFLSQTASSRVLCFPTSPGFPRGRFGPQQGLQPFPHLLFYLLHPRPPAPPVFSRAQRTGASARLPFLRPSAACFAVVLSEGKAFPRGCRSAERPGFRARSMLEERLGNMLGTTYCGPVALARR
ncbi:hypothetical protein TRVL_03688 [Trypanosoma vivax]|nr:hypothetical protein TRVL_03688 [Trypanosoma vivax]